MLTMPRKKADKPASSSKPKRVRAGYNVNVWLDEAIGTALDSYLANADPTPTMTAVVESAMREFLRRAGHWPPPAPPVRPS